MQARIDLDANATTRPLKEVREAVMEALSGEFANPSSLHAAGRAAARLLSTCRRTVAEAFGARPSEVVFTSGATEADRLGLMGTLAADRDKRHLVVSAIEHPALHDLAEDLKRRVEQTGVSVTFVRPGADGRCSADNIADALQPDTNCVALMWANNETGVLQPIEDVAALCRARKIPFLVDAVQAAGKLDVNFAQSGVDLMAISAHKIHGPAGVGALLIRNECRWKPPFPSTHEARRRSGTEPLPAIAGFAAAAAAVRSAPHAQVAALRDQLERTLVGALEGVTVNGTAERTPNTTNLCFHGLEGDRLLALLDRAGIDASNGSACSSGSAEPSHVLSAMGRSRKDALSSVRFSLSRFTTQADIARAIAVTLETVETLQREQKLRGRSRR